MEKYILTLLMFCFYSSFGQHGLLVEIPLDEQVELSEVIVKGEVVEKESMWDQGNKMIYTVHKIKIFTEFKGASEAEIYLITKGGVVGDKALKVYPNLTLNIADRGVFIAKQNHVSLEIPSVNTLYEPIGLNQGFFKINEYTEEVTNNTSSFSSIDELEKEIETFTGVNKKQIQPMPQEKKTAAGNNLSVLSGGISSFSPSEIPAGNNTILTINGTGFGNTVGEIFFKDSNQGGLATVSTLNSSIVSWTDTEIQVKVPGDAGTGPVQVKPAIGGTFVKSGLIITHAYATLRTDSNVDEETEFYIHHVATDVNGTGLATNINMDGNYLFKFNNDYYTNTDAVNTFTSLFEDLVCSTGINFELSSMTVGSNIEASDNINLVSFGSSSSGTALATCYQWFNGIDTFWFFGEMDIIVNNSVAWNFSMDTETQSDEYDFHNVLYHELGHAAGMGHVVDANKLMHYSVGRGEVASERVTGIHEPIIWKTNNDVNSVNPDGIQNIELADCYTPLSLEESNATSLVIYYNDVQFLVTGTIKIKTLQLFNITGRQVLSRDINDYQASISRVNLERNVYIATFVLENGSKVVRKLIN